MALVGILAAALPACHVVPPPTVQQGLTYGFGTPKQAFASWRTALQGDLLAEEYRCFSQAWKRDNNARTLTYYGAARDDIFARIPKLRWFVYRAEDPETLLESDRAVILQSRIPGPLWIDDRFIVVTLAKEAYVAIYSEEDPAMVYASELVPDLWRSELLDYSERGDRLTLTVEEFDEFTEGMAPDAVHELRAGWQWKILAFNLTKERAEPVDELR